MNLSAPFIKRPVMTTFLMLAIVLAGLLAFKELPVSDVPTIEYPNITVETYYTGAAAETVLKQITIPLEKQLVQVMGVEEMSSTSDQGSSRIFLKFDLSYNMDKALRDVQTAIARAEYSLPRDLEHRPHVSMQQKGQEPIIYFVLTSASSNVTELRAYADNFIIPRFSRISGVAGVSAFGDGKSIWVKLNPELMAAREVGFDQVIDTIQQATADIPLGSIQTNSKTLAIEMERGSLDIKAFESLKIGQSKVRIKDIGIVSDTSDHNTEFFYVNKEESKPALILSLSKVSDGNTVAITNSVHEVLNQLRTELPSFIQLKIQFEKAVWIKESLNEVSWTLFIAFVLVAIVIYLSLGRFIEALIITIALPLSLVGTFGIMYLLGYSLDILSLLALTLSIGFVVDDAIVVLENIVRYKEKGLSALEASLKGSKEICFTILTMTLSLIAVFIPQLFMGGMNGRLFREFSVTLAVAILVSGFISLTVTPLLCSRFLTKKHVDTLMQTRVNHINNLLVHFYERTLKWCFSHTKRILVLTALLFIVTIPLFFKLPVNLIPSEDRGVLFSFINLPSGLPPKEVKKFQEKLEGIVQANPHAVDFLDINFSSGLFFITHLKPLGQRPPQKEVIEEMKKTFDQIAGINVYTSGYQLINLDFDMGHGGQFNYTLRGQDSEEVERVASLLTEALTVDPEITFASNSLKRDAPKLAVQINEELVHQLGLNKRQIQSLFNQAYGHTAIGKIQHGIHQEMVYLDLQNDYKGSIKALDKLFLTTPEHTLVPLKAVASWHEKLASPSIYREEQLPSAKVSFALKDTSSPSAGLKRVKSIANQVLPDNVSGLFSGAAKAINSSLTQTLYLLLAAALVMYIVLGILYESAIHPLTILSSLPFACLGGVITLFLFNEPISIFSAVGFLLLIGIVKKNGIMMVDFALEAKKQGKSPEEAILQGCLARFRPIMMTTFAAIGGALPIAFGFGDGGSSREGLGLVIVGGLIFSQILTLYVTPIIYLKFEHLFERKPWQSRQEQT